MFNKHLFNCIGGSRHHLLVIYIHFVIGTLSKYSSLKVQNLLEHLCAVTLVL